MKRLLLCLPVLALAGCTSTPVISTSAPSQSEQTYNIQTMTPPVDTTTPSQPAELLPSSATTPPSSGPSQLTRVHDPGTVTGQLSGPCHTRDHGQLPDPRCTPGGIDPAVTQANIRSTICVAGYTATVRPPSSQTNAAKFEVVVPDYGLKSTFIGELDHLVSLELGGSNDLSNLWPEAGSIPNQKDATENKLRRMVCTGQISLHEAQERIATNWETALSP